MFTFPFREQMKIIFNCEKQNTLKIKNIWSKYKSLKYQLISHLDLCKLTKNQSTLLLTVAKFRITGVGLQLISPKLNLNSLLD